MRRWELGPLSINSGAFALLPLCRLLYSAPWCKLGYPPSRIGSSARQLCWGRWGRVGAGPSPTARHGPVGTHFPRALFPSMEAHTHVWEGARSLSHFLSPPSLWFGTLRGMFSIRNIA